MARQPEGEVRAALEQANAYQSQAWQLWAYTADGRNLILKVDPYISLKDRYVWLVFRRPSYMRLPFGVGAAEFAVGRETLTEMEFPPPPSVPLEDRHLIAIRWEGQVFCVVCEEVALYDIPRAGAA
jgi:hypothetical protein